MHESSYCFSAS